MRRWNDSRDKLEECTSEIVVKLAHNVPEPHDYSVLLVVFALKNGVRSYLVNIHFLFTVNLVKEGVGVDSCLVCCDGAGGV